MSLARVTRILGRFANVALGPLGLELRRRLPDGRRRRTMLAALEQLARSGFRPATVVDVGVAAGTEPLYRVFPDARHVLVEPLAEYEPDLVRIVANLPRAEIVRAAAAAKSGEIVLNLGSNLELTAQRAFRDPSLAPVTRRRVPATTLDEIWRMRALTGPALLKIDVNGEELDVLRGASHMLGSSDYVILEVGIREVLAGAPTVAEVVTFMADRGFVLDDILEPAYGPDGSLRMADWGFARATKR